MNQANQQAPRDIHLLTTDVLLSDLVDGREVMVAAGAAFSLGTDDSRSVLEWYRKNASKWARNLNGDDIEAIIDAAGEKPPAINNDGTISRETHVKRSLRLVRLTAHRFAGLHAYGSSTEAPETFTFVTSKDATLFEGANGSGKTSILNAIVWCLTGEIIRSQRAPEPGSTEFACEITRPDGSVSTHQMSSVTPMPNGNSELPVDGQPIPADTWVELIFADADGTILPPVRRAQTRNSRGKLQEIGPDLDAAGVDPIAWRIATSMPAILPFLSVGSTSHLGQAVARLTGLADLVDLAKHATKAAERISKRSVNEIEQEIDGIANRYGEAREDLEAVISEYNEIGFPGELPSILADDGRERLASIAKHFVDAKAEALTEARTVLGDGFNPEDKSSRDDLEGNIQPAIAELQHIQKLPSFARFLALSADAEEQKKVNDLLETVGREAEVLAELAAAPDRAARARLYALVSVWIHEHEHSHRDHCPLCAGDLRDACDPITGVPVTTHLAEAERDRDLVAQTVAQWASGWHARLTKELPDAIANEVRQELPDRPADLLITAMTTELFATESFKGSLSALADDAALLVKERAAQLPEFQEPTERSMPPNIVELVRELLMLMQRIDRAISFARWRAENRVTLQKFIVALRHGEDGAADADRAIGRRLSRLLSIVESVAPLNKAATLVNRMEARRGEREMKRKRIALCRRAATALELLMPLGALAQTQVDDLRTKLETRTDFWRRAIFLNATTYAPDLTGTVMDAKGTLGLQVGRDGVNAPAQHISNASALRGALFGFFLAFREHVLTQRGGVQTLVLDDPQELLDNDNRERLARGLCQVAGDAQLIVTSHDRKFARCLVAEHREKVEHLSVHPVNGVHPTVFVAPAQEEIVRKRKAFLDNPDNHALAQDYASDMRVYIEGRLGDLFDNIAHPAYASPTKAPTLIPLVDRLRALVNAGTDELFKHPLVKQFVDDHALAEGADARRVLNQSHHDKASIKYMDVKNLDETFSRIRSRVDKLHEQFRLHRWREPLAPAVQENVAVVALRPMASPKINVPIFQDIAAFVKSGVSDASQDMSCETLDDGWFEGKSLYYIRGETLGFAIPSGSVAVVEAEPYPGRDQNLVIARDRNQVFARRLSRSPGSIDISLAALMPDPRQSRPTMTYDESKIRLHRIVGAIFTDMPPPTGKGEATPVDEVTELQTVKVAYRVKEESAIPLALPGQIVLGGEQLTAAQLNSLEGALVAVTLGDGACVFKRLGSRLPGRFSQLLQLETIGGLGSSVVVATEVSEQAHDVPIALSVRRVVGVLY